MSEYTEGVCSDGAAILKDGQPMSIDEICSALESRDKLAEALRYLKAFPSAPKAHECAGAALDAAGIEYGEEA